MNFWKVVKFVSLALAGQMIFSSPPIQLNSADFDKSIDELRQAIQKSLNDWVDLQNNIRDEIANLSKINWVNPLVR